MDYSLPHPEPIEARCRDCGQEYAGGTIRYRSLDAYDDAPEPYCAVCESDDLEFFEVP